MREIELQVSRRVEVAGVAPAAGEAGQREVGGVVVAAVAARQLVGQELHHALPVSSNSCPKIRRSIFAFGG